MSTGLWLWDVELLRPVIQNCSRLGDPHSFLLLPWKQSSIFPPLWVSATPVGLPWLPCAAAGTLSLLPSCFTAPQEQSTFGWTMASTKPVWKQEEPLTGCLGMGTGICKQEIPHIRNANRFCASRSHCIVLTSFLHTSSWGTCCGVGHETWFEESRGAKFGYSLTSSPN